MSLDGRSRLIRRLNERLPTSARGPVLRGGWRAYEALLARNGRVIDPRLVEQEAEGLPIPSARLRVRVAGDADPMFFLRGGKANLELMHHLVARNEVSLSARRTALDFGCGCGRMARWWPDYFDAALFGCDIDYDLAAWCQNHLPRVTAVQTGLNPPLPYPDREFDFVYALSVFTHLPLEMEHMWLLELRRVLKPGGHLFFSVSGSRFADRLTDDEQAEFRRGKPVVRFPEAAGSNACATYHPPEYVRDRMLGEFELIDSVLGPDAGLRGQLKQDAYLVRRNDRA